MLLTRLSIALLTALSVTAQPQLPEQQAVNPSITTESIFASKDWDPNADADAPEWTNVTGVLASRDLFGEPLPLAPTEIRSRWTKKYLYLLFVCPYEKLNLKPEPVTNEETDKLWKWEVAEAFIGSDYLNPSKYKEFQVSPQGEYVDLEIDREHPKEQKGIDWDSGMSVKGRIDAAKKIWYGEMRIPFAALDVKAPKIGVELRIGLFRITGSEPKRTYISWRATGASTLHVPEAFGSLVLSKEPEKDKEKEKTEKEKSEKEKSEKDRLDKAEKEKS